ncbi:hypothetical protein H2201_005834 [Coniosporium apollinis]|uniref:Uncharacterized protein n=1 Tax=Coniosporium apollinis TaxID=61459 RepID=A0ABQ9NQ90_9PEZI|nr:hypothetical protein H2201_005834 [Coniosporium apollinis]
MRAAANDEDDDDFYCHGNGREYLHFIEPSMPNTTCFIWTPYWISYPAALRHKLVSDGFNTTRIRGSTCGWAKAADVERTAVYRGAIGYRPSDGLDAEAAPIVSEEVVARIVKVLEKASHEASNYTDVLNRKNPEPFAAGGLLLLAAANPAFFFGSSCGHGEEAHYLHVINPAAPNITWYIYTGYWIVSYPKIVRHKLIEAGFTVTHLSGCYCDWTVIAAVKKAAVYHGHVGYRPTEGVDADKAPLADEHDGEKIAHVLETTYPVAEVVLAVVLPLLFFVVFPCLLVCCGPQPEPKKQ